MRRSLAAVLLVLAPLIACDEDARVPNLTSEMVAELERSGEHLDLLDDTAEGRDEALRTKVAGKVELKEGETLEGISLAMFIHEGDPPVRTWVVWVDHVLSQCFGPEPGCPEPMYGRGVYFFDAETLKGGMAIVF